MGTAHTWADGFGTWHARVPNQPHRHEMTAYQAIRAELQARQGAPLPGFGLAVVAEDDTTVTYREDWSRNIKAQKGATMQNIATYARIQHNVEGQPLDPRTATCDQHRIAAPYSDTAKGDDSTVLYTNEWPCVVCPLPYADLIGTEVINTSHSGVYLYGGDGEKDRPGGWTTLKLNMRTRQTVLESNVESVAPADTPINEKDPRITIEKLPKKRDYQDAGVWLPHVDHPALADMRPTAKKTKRDALAYAARRLAIAEYHAARQEATA